MYSHEIQEVMERYNYHLPAVEYLNIELTSPQISRVKYEPYGNFFEIWTKDGFYWKFDIQER